MISQTLRNTACGSSNESTERGAANDDSMKLRLQQMRVCKEQILFCESEGVDNSITRTMYAIYNFKRLRHADKIAVTYWMIASETG